MGIPRSTLHLLKKNSEVDSAKRLWDVGTDTPRVYRTPLPECCANSLHENVPIPTYLFLHGRFGRVSGWGGWKGFFFCQNLEEKKKKRIKKRTNNTESGSKARRRSGREVFGKKRREKKDFFFLFVLFGVASRQPHQKKEREKLKLKDV